MSNALALAAVSAVLKDLLDNGLIDNNLRAAFANDVRVSALAPDLIDTQPGQPARLNLFLYRVTPNAGWRNVDLPARDAQGNRVSNPPLALDLHYLITAYAGNDFEAEILLGYAMQLLHETPGLSTRAIQTALNPVSPVGAGLLPPALQTLRAAELADQVETITIAPEVLSSEELSKLWSALQAHYRPSAAYIVTTVLIEARRSTRRAPQVRRANVRGLTLRQPVVERVLAQGPTAAGPAEALIQWGDRLILLGKNLRGPDGTKLRVGDVVVEPAAADTADDRIEIPLQSPPFPINRLRAGVQTVQVMHELNFGTPADPHRGIQSPAAAFFLRPRIARDATGNAQVTVSGAQPDDNGTRRATITVQFEPVVGRSQRVRLLLNGWAAAPADAPDTAFSFKAPPRTTDVNTVAFGVRHLPSGDYLVRVEVDGAESVPDVETNALSPQFNQYTGTPRVTL
jgi:hypothetical protein